MDKPRAQTIRPELTRLPRLTVGRRFLRHLCRLIGRIAVTICTRPQVRGLDHFPRRGPALVVINHLGDADVILGLALSPTPVESLAKSELYDFPFLGWLLESYGVIWIHRGQPDRRALRAALNGLQEGRLIQIAPEGRESLTSSLEEGTRGAAFLAITANVPVVPVTFTGTENRRIYGNLKRLRRTAVSLTVGPSFTLDPLPDHRQALEQGTQTIMNKLAQQLPEEYRGFYR